MKMKILSVLVPLALLPGLAQAFGTGMQGCSGDCTACHSLNKDEAAKILTALDPKIVVTDVSQAPARGLYQIGVKKEAEKGILYIDFSKKHVVIGSIVDVSTKTDLTRKTIEDARTVNVSKIPTKDALIMGNPKGKKTIYVFTDPDCPFCGKLHGELNKLVAADREVNVRLILNPLENHPNSGWKSNTMVCTSKKNMKEAVGLLETSFAGKSFPKKECGYDYSKKARKEMKALGITVTPTMVFEDGRAVVGYKTVEELKGLVDQHSKK